MARLPVIGVTMGDPAGVGPEVCLRALGDPAVLERCVPVVFGDAGVLRAVAEACGLATPADVVSRGRWRDRPVSSPAVVDCEAIEAAAVRPGEVAAACGRAAYVYIETAIAAALAGEVAAVATAPIHKEALRLAGVAGPGHTEIFAVKTAAPRVCMMLVADELAVSFVTTHVGYAEVPALLTPERVLEVIELTAAAVERLRGRAGGIAVCGLNPHAGEHGLFGGSEEARVIAPAVASAREKGIDVFGPVPPDTAFVPARRAAVDGIVCMYHDQGHIPFKMLAFDRGVNVTLGLPIVRTSVDHGTAFDIAWQGRASPASLVQAILLAARLAGPGERT